MDDDQPFDSERRNKTLEYLRREREKARRLWQEALLARSAAAQACARSIKSQKVVPGANGSNGRQAAPTLEDEPRASRNSRSRDPAIEEVLLDEPRLLQPGASVEEQARLLDHAFDAILARSISGRRITFWNRGAERLYGWSRDEAVGQSKPDLLGTEYPEPLEEIERRVRATGRWEGQLVQRTKGGRRVVVESRWTARSHSRHPADLVLQIENDITAKVDAERRLDETDELLRLLVSNVRDYALFVLDPQGRVMSWNEGARRLKQYERPEVIGQHFSMFYEPEQVIACKPERALEIARGEGQYHDEGWRLRKDGSRFWADVLITALYDDSGTLRGYAKITRDLTEKHLEAERLIQLEAVKSQFLRIASHELRGPLGTLRGYTSLLREGALQHRPSDQARAYEVIDVKAQHMSSLVNQMLETARLEEGRLKLSLQSLDLRSPVAEAYEEALRLAPGSHEIVLEKPGDPVLVQADEHRIIGVVHNLLDNAVKYSPAGGVVRCQVAVERDTAVVEVSDNGMGISEDEMPKLFTRFGRIVNDQNSHISGVGLGLYLCRELAQMHGGEMSVRSEPGRGSSFRLTLPLV